MYFFYLCRRNLSDNTHQWPEHHHRLPLRAVQSSRYATGQQYAHRRTPGHCWSPRWHCARFGYYWQTWLSWQPHGEHHRRWADDHVHPRPWRTPRGHLWGRHRCHAYRERPPCGFPRLFVQQEGAWKKEVPTSREDYVALQRTLQDPDMPCHCVPGRRLLRTWSKVPRPSGPGGYQREGKGHCQGQGHGCRQRQPVQVSRQHRLCCNDWSGGHGSCPKPGLPGTSGQSSTSESTSRWSQIHWLWAWYGPYPDWLSSEGRLRGHSPTLDLRHTSPADITR